MANVFDVANLFISLAEDQAKEELGDLMTDLKLQKLLYFAQSWHLARHGEPLFDSRIEAWKHGPVIPEAYAAFKSSGSQPLRAKPVRYEAFSSDELDTIMDVFCYYGRYSAYGLREMSHEKGTPWRTFYQPNVMHIEIPTECLMTYFRGQPPLETVRDRIRKRVEAGEIQVIAPDRSADGYPILPSEEIEDWGDWDDD